MRLEEEEARYSTPDLEERGGGEDRERDNRSHEVEYGLASNVPRANLHDR